MASSLEIYKASAGSGKTYQLALKYITLLLGDFQPDGSYKLAPALGLNRHREILAITFTNKATQEMKSRIIKELRLLSDLKAKSGYRTTMHRLVAPDDPDCLDRKVDERVSATARAALTGILFNLGEMSVSTIDSFFQRILRSFAYEADLSGNYDLMLENKVMTETAIDNLLALAVGLKGVVVPRGVNVGYLKQRIRDLIVDSVLSDKKYYVFNSGSQIRKELLKFMDDLSGEEYAERKAGIMEFLSKPNAIKDLTERLKGVRQELVGEIALGSLGIDKIPGVVLNGKTSGFLHLLYEGAIEKLTGSNLAYFTGKSDVNSLMNKNHTPASAKEAFARQFLPLAEPVIAVWTIDAMLKNMNFMGLFREILYVEQVVKARTNTIMLSDTNELLRLIIDGSDSPFIYERIGQRLRHFLIDEFQDTSRMQWGNLTPLLKESMSVGGQNLVIGDVKQCIYRFRNSDPALLQNLEHDSALSPFATGIDSKTMDTNWRSSGLVVDFNNRIFSEVAATANIDLKRMAAYNPEGVAQKASNADMPGYVDIMAASKSSNKGLENMVEHMQRELNAGYPASQIVVLARKNAEASLIVNYLLTQTRPGMPLEGIAILSDEALYVASAQSVQWIIGKLRQLDKVDRREERPLNKRGLPVSRQTDVDRMLEIIDANKDSEQKVEAMIEQFNRQRMLPDDDEQMLQQLRDLNGGLSLYELVEEIVGMLPNPEWRQKEAQYISALQDLIFDYCSRKSPSLHGFLDLWDENHESKATIGVAPDVNAIRVMTIHKSKGLEFAAVHLPMLKGEFDDIKGHKWFNTDSFFDAIGWEGPRPEYFPQVPSKKVTPFTMFSAQYSDMIEESTVDEINSIYVAFTRAKQELIVTIEHDTSKKVYKEFTPAGLLCPLLDKLKPQDPEDPFHWTFGEPTDSCLLKEDDSDFETLMITDYELATRDNIWQHVKVSEEDDGGQRLIFDENTTTNNS